MSDLDENLTSILSSLIDSDGIETPNTSELPIDNSSFNESRLDFDNLASCITGNDASLHQSSDENVSSLLESHLNELSQAENIATAENLNDVTPFDLDKPIESLLESAPIISQGGCADSHNSIVDKANELQNSSTDLNTIQNVAQECLDSLQPTISALNPNGIVVSNSENISNVEQSSTYHNCNESVVNAVCNDDPAAADREEFGTIRQVTEVIESNSDIENQGNLSVVESCPIDDEPPTEEECLAETIIADEIVNEAIFCKESVHEGKKRRRILVYNDGESDYSDEIGEKRERQTQSTSPSPSHHSNELEHAEHQDEHLSDEYTNISDDQYGDNFDDDDDYIRDPNERPGPKSKKQSTHLYNALKAKALLESAIVIPARKKKKRVIDSDDEYSNSILNQPIDSVDDIGLIPEDNNDLPPIHVSEKIKSEFEVETKPIGRELKVNTEKHSDGLEMETSFIKVEPISRATTQIKMEKYIANNNRRSQRKKEPKDIFELPLNAPYVDTSSDEDYFLPNESSNRRNQHNHAQKWGNSRMHSSSMHQRRKKGHIPDDIYFNAKVPLHVLYSYDDSSSDDGERNEYSTKRPVQPLPPSFHPTNRTLNKMPPVHKIHKVTSKHAHSKAAIQRVVPKQSSRSFKEAKSTSKPTVFEQLDKLKRMLRTSGIKISVNELLKGSKTFQERCERIRNTLYQNGIEGEPTLAKCKKLKKQLKLKEEIAGLDPSAIIESKEEEEEGRPKRTTRRATRRNYVYDDASELTKSQQPEIRVNTSQLLQKIKEFIDSDSEYDGDDHSKNSSNVDPSNMVEAIIDSADTNTPMEIPTLTYTTHELVPLQTAVDQTPASIQCATTLQQL